MQLEDFKINPLAQKVPRPSAKDYAQLKGDIEQNGQQDPITRHKGEILDGQTRLKICIELGREPLIEEYTGSLPVAQFILSRNIRRNLTELQRDQLIADFAAIIIPQVEAEMKKRKQAGLKKGDIPPVRVNSRARETWSDLHPGTVALAEAAGTTTWKARQVKEINNKAPELLSKVTELGGLNETAKEARRRAAIPAVKPRPLTVAERYARHTAQLDAMPGRFQDRVLTAEQVDPEFADKPHEFARRYGHVTLHTKAEIEADRDRAAFIAWRGTVKEIRAQLRSLIKIAPFTNAQIARWLTGAGQANPSQYAARYAEMEEMLNLFAAAHAAVAAHIAWLPTQNLSGKELVNGKP